MTTVMDTVKPQVRYYVPCPVCGHHEFRIDHIIGKSAGPWYCGWCGAGVTIDTRDYMTTSHVQVVADTTSRWEWLICELVPQDEPVRIAYEVLNFGNYEDDEDREQSRRYLVEEHQCPTNITSSIEAVFVGISDDAHGIFRYLRTLPARRNEGPGDTTGSNARWVEQHAPGTLGTLGGQPKAEEETD